MFFLSDDESFFPLRSQLLIWSIFQCQSIISKNQRGAVHFGESIKIPGKFLRSAARSIIAGTNVPIYSRNWFILQCCRNCKCKALRATNIQSQKKSVSASAMLNGKFLWMRKVFATCSLLAEEFPDNLEKCPVAIQNIQIKCKVSGWSGKYADNLRSVQII